MRKWVALFKDIIVIIDDIHPRWKLTFPQAVQLQYLLEFTKMFGTYLHNNINLKYRLILHADDVLLLF